MKTIYQTIKLSLTKTLPVVLFIIAQASTAAHSKKTGVLELGSSGFKAEAFDENGEAIDIADETEEDVKVPRRTPRVGKEIADDGTVSEEKKDGALVAASELLDIFRAHGLNPAEDLDIIATAWARHPGENKGDPNHVLNILAEILKLAGRDVPLNSLHNHILTEEEESRFEAMAGQRWVSSLGNTEEKIGAEIAKKMGFHPSMGTSLGRPFFVAAGGTSVDIYSPALGDDPEFFETLRIGSNTVRLYWEKDYAPGETLDKITPAHIGFARGRVQGAINDAPHNQEVKGKLLEQFNPLLNPIILIGGPAKSFGDHMKNQRAAAKGAPLESLHSGHEAISLNEIANLMNREYNVGENVYRSLPALVLVHTAMNDAFRVGTGQNLILGSGTMRNVLWEKPLSQRRKESSATLKK